MTAQEKLRYAVADSSFGKVLVAKGDRGIRAILIEPTFENLTYAIRAACPDADIHHDDSLTELAAKVAAHIKNPKSALDIELDMRGNAFQMKVWNALREIPVGTTVSYGKLANKIGAPGAARAVGEACAANILAVVIPCHRVVKSDGSISGYRWGVKNKQRLLEIEGARLNIQGAA
jgi:AraC family transcriptional regulator, regulatory protein of adaptative response / methylated-DNA-[protein]-cysteine methyltransferase